MSHNLLVLKNVYKDFGEYHILKGISFSVRAGEIYGLLGPSGCGKTTSVKVAAGILEATSGEAAAAGERIPNLEVLNKIGYMAQSDALYENLSGRENLAFLGELYGLKGAYLEERIAYAADIVAFGKDLDKRVGSYSGGMKRRLSLAAALLHNPDILILDEPTVGIDPLLRKSIWDELYRLAAAGKAILVTTHVMDEAEKCTRLSMMRDGALIAEGTPAEIKAGVGATTMDEAFILHSKEDSEDAH